MRYMRLTNGGQAFTATVDNEIIQLNWNTPITLTPTKYVSLLKLQIGPVRADDHNRFVTVRSNIIARTLHNPLRELACIQVPRKSQFVDSEYVKGKFLNKSEHNIFDSVPSKILVQILILIFQKLLQNSMKLSWRIQTAYNSL